MAFTNGNDLNVIQASDSAVVGAGAGNDVYVLDTGVLSANQQVQISDTQGVNTLRLVGGLTITSSAIAADTVQLTLSNGAVITVLGASTFSFQTGGNALTGAGSTTQTYSQFVTASLGAAAVPTGNTVVMGTPNTTVNANGGTTVGGGAGGGTGNTSTLTAGADNRTGTDGADTFDGSANTNNQTPNTLNPFDTINGGAGVDRIIVAQNIVDADFTGVTSVENITTNGNNIALGFQAQRAGITSVTNTNSVASTLTLGAGFTRDTGSFSLGGSVVDNVLVNNGGDGQNYRVTFTSAEVGNNNPNDNTATAPQDGGLAVRFQSETIGTDNLTGGVSRFDDEGVAFVSSNGTVRFDVRDISGTQRGTFQQAILGTSGGDVLTTIGAAGVAALTTVGIYINAGEGNDSIQGSTLTDVLVGGVGADQIRTGGGRDTVIAGAGNDRVAEEAGAALTNIDAGAGDDVVFFTGGAIQATGLANTRDTVAGGDGIDTLGVSTANANAITAVGAGETNTISGFETIRTDGAALNLTTANIQADITTVAVDMAANGTVNFEAGSRVFQVGAEAVAINGTTLAAGGTLGGAVILNAAGAAATDVLALNNGRLTGAVNVFNGQAVTAGGFETLNISTGTTVTAAQTLGNVIVNASAPETNVTVNISGLNALSLPGANNLSSNTTGTLVVNASTLTAQNPGTNTLTLTTGAQAGNGSVSVTGSAGDDVIASTGRAFIDGGAGADDIAGAGGNDTLLGGDGNDILTIGAGNDSANGGAGDDRIVVGAVANLTGADTLAGGDGRDTLDVSGGAIAAGGQINVSGFEVLSFSNLGAATTQDMVQFINNTTFDTIRVNSTVNNLIIQNATPGIANLVFADNRGAAVVTQFQNLVNTATNTLNVRAENLPTPNVATARNVGTLTLDNGALMGTDILNIGDRTNPLATDSLTVATLNGSDLDTINVSGLIAASITAGTLNGTARTVTVNAQSNTGATFVFDGAAAGSNGVQFALNGSNTAANTLTGNANSDTISGGSVADVLSGGAGGDVINGNGGADNITGGDGRDTINGGDGIDTYVYANAGESNITAVNALAFDIVTVTAGDIVDPATNVTAVRANEVTILGAASTDGATLLASLNTAFNANGQAGVDAILFEYVTGGRQFLVIDLDNNNNVTAADQIIEIVGTVNTLALTGANVAIS